MVQRNGLGGGAVVDTSSISLRNWANQASGQTDQVTSSLAQPTGTLLTYILRSTVDHLVIAVPVHFCFMGSIGIPLEVNPFKKGWVWLLACVLLYSSLGYCNILCILLEKSNILRILVTFKIRKRRLPHLLKSCEANFQNCESETQICGLYCSSKN